MNRHCRLHKTVDTLSYFKLLLSTSYNQANYPVPSYLCPLAAVIVSPGTSKYLFSEIIIRRLELFSDLCGGTIQKCPHWNVGVHPKCNEGIICLSRWLYQCAACQTISSMRLFLMYSLQRPGQSGSDMPINHPSRLQERSAVMMGKDQWLSFKTV